MTISRPQRIIETLALTGVLAAAPACLERAYQDAVELTFAMASESDASPGSGSSTGEATGETSSDSGTDADTEPTTGDTSPAVCGDGVVDPPEECDDGNRSDADDCLTSCTLATCGDGHVHGELEACDDGNTSNDDACTNFCTLAVCGDGIVQESLGEECDDEHETCNGCVRDRLVFITSAHYEADLGGLAGADFLCQQHADAAGIGLERTYRAWLSTPEASPQTRFDPSPGRYVRPDGVVVAMSFDELVDGVIDALIVVSELNETVAGPVVWSNTDLDGTVISLVDHCEGWTHSDWMSGKKGRWGRSKELDNWTDEPDPEFNPTFCNDFRRLYCFEQ